MKRKQATLTILAAFGCLVIFLFLKSADNGATEFARIEQTVRAIDQRNDELDTAVMSLRLGMVGDYDELTRCELELQESKNIFLNQLVDSASGSHLEQQLRPLLEQKVLLATDFKANHAVERNSVSGFRHKIRQARTSESGEVLDFRDSLSDLEMRGAHFTITGDVCDKQRFESSIATAQEKLVGDQLDSSTRASLALAIRHAKNLVNKRIELDDTVFRLVSVPIKDTTGRIMNNSTKEHERKSQVSGLFRAGLFASIFVMLGFCLYQYFSLLKQEKAIQRANSMLENRVEERTADLARVNVDLESANAEAEKLALVARYTDNAVLIMDSETHLEWVNAGFTRITGYEPEEVLGRRTRDFLYGSNPDPKVLAYVDSQLRTREGFNVEVVKYRKDGTQFWVAIEVRPIHDDSGAVKRYIAIESDITQRVKSEQERQRLNERLVDASRHAGMAEVATGVLHNVGNILNSVNVSVSLIRKQHQNSAFNKLEKITGLIAEHQDGFADFVRDDQRGKKIPAYMVTLAETMGTERQSIDNEFADMLTNVEHIKEIVAVQQSMAKSSGLKQELCSEKLVSDAITANKGSLANHSVAISTQIEDDLPLLVSDKNKILQILVNLVKNAIDALVEHNIANRKIDIQVDSCGDQIRFHVVDNGIGIPSDKLDEIFQHGFTTKETGHGFGLHSSANAATELGGSLNVTSEGHRLGATFELSLPINFAPDHAADAATEEAPSVSRFPAPANTQFFSQPTPIEV